MLDLDASYSPLPPMFRADQPWSVRLAKALVIMALVVLYCALYLRGLDFGRPMCEHPDEYGITWQAISMVANRSYRPPMRAGAYGTLSMYIQCGVCAAAHLYNNARGVYVDLNGNPIKRDLADIAKRATDPDRFHFLFLGRLSSAIYAGILFWIVYVLCVRLFRNRAIACLAVLAAMVNPLMVQQGHFSLPNTLATMFAVGAVLCGLVFYQERKKRYLYAGAVLAGLGVGAKVTVVWAVVPLVAAAVIRLRRGSLKHIPLLAVVSGGVFVLVTPCIVLDTKWFMDDLLLVVREYRAGEALDTRDFQPHAFGPKPVREFASRHPILQPVLYWMHQGKAHFVATAAGLLFLPFVAGSAGALVLIFPVLFFVAMGVQPKAFSPNYLPLVPFWAVGFGATVAVLYRALAKLAARTSRPAARTLIAAAASSVLAVVALTPPTASSLRIVRQFTTKDPYQVTLAWLEKNVPKGAKVTAEGGIGPVFTLPKDRVDLKIEPPGVFSAKPYLDFLDQDYFVAVSPSLYDRYPCVRKLFPTGNAAVQELMRRTRDLNEGRLELVRHVTPEECGYVRYAELPIVEHDIYIYRVPKVTPVRFSVAEFELDAALKEHLNKAAVPEGQIPLIPGGRIAVRPRLDAGEYDIFLNVSCGRASAGETPQLAVRIDDSEPYYIDWLLTGGRYYFIPGLHVTSSRTVEIRVELIAAQSNQPPVLIEEIVIVPVAVQALEQDQPAVGP